VVLGGENIYTNGHSIFGGVTAEDSQGDCVMHIRRFLTIFLGISTLFGGFCLDLGFLLVSSGPCLYL
jgi:hypothetical protein